MLSFQKPLFKSGFFVFSGIIFFEVAPLSQYLSILHLIALKIALAHSHTLEKSADRIWYAVTNMDLCYIACLTRLGRLATTAAQSV
jgi:hypothetical protein